MTWYTLTECNFHLTGPPRIVPHAQVVMLLLVADGIKVRGINKSFSMKLFQLVENREATRASSNNANSRLHFARSTIIDSAIARATVSSYCPGISGVTPLNDPRIICRDACSYDKGNQFLQFQFGLTLQESFIFSRT